MELKDEDHMQADKFKNEGNMFFSQAQYEKALEQYSKAICNIFSIKKCNIF